MAAFRLCVNAGPRGDPARCANGSSQHVKELVAVSPGQRVADSRGEAGDLGETRPPVLVTGCVRQPGVSTGGGRPIFRKSRSISVSRLRSYAPNSRKKTSITNMPARNPAMSHAHLCTFFMPLTDVIRIPHSGHFVMSFSMPLIVRFRTPEVNDSKLR